MMENNELILTEEVLGNQYENMSTDYEGDLTLDNVNPWLLIAMYNNMFVA